MKKNAKKAKEPKTEMPDLVTAMMKLVERLEVLEKKTELVLSRVSNMPSEMRNAVQSIQRPQVPYPAQSAVPRPEAGLSQNQGPRERILYQAICSDCRKSCEVPFKPTGERPVYCKECFAIRKAGHVPKDLTSNIVVPPHLREVKIIPPAATGPAVVSKVKKTAAKPAKKAAKKKKK